MPFDGIPYRESRAAAPAAHGAALDTFNKQLQHINYHFKPSPPRGEGLGEGDVNSTDYAYDSAGRTASITYPGSGWKVGYKRDAAGQISYVSATRPGFSAASIAAGITYLPFGPVTGFTYGNSIVNTRTYDNDYRVTAITDTGSATVQSLAYTYDDNDNVRILRNNTALNTTETLRFDSVDRLVFASGGYGTVSNITYDSNGNRLTYGATTYTISGTSNRLTNDGTNAIGYIATGNINSIGANSMTYNKANQLATATVSGTTSTYTYDAFGQRVKYVVGAGTAVVQQYGPNLLMEKGSSETDAIIKY